MATLPAAWRRRRRRSQRSGPSSSVQLSLQMESRKSITEEKLTPSRKAATQLRGHGPHHLESFLENFFPRNPPPLLFHRSVGVGVEKAACRMSVEERRKRQNPFCEIPVSIYRLSVSEWEKFQEILDLSTLPRIAEPQGDLAEFGVRSKELFHHEEDKARRLLLNANMDANLGARACVRARCAHDARLASRKHTRASVGVHVRIQ